MFGSFSGLCKATTGAANGDNGSKAWLAASFVLAAIPGGEESRALRGFAPGKWLAHFEKHGAETGAATAVEYLRGANNLIRGGEGVEMAVRAGGDKLCCRPTNSASSPKMARLFGPTSKQTKAGSTFSIKSNNRMSEFPKLSCDEARQLADSLQALSTRLGREVSLRGLLTRWSGFVAEVERGYELTVYDFTNDLSTRDHIEEVLTALPGELQVRLAAKVKQTDERFMAATEGVVKALRDRPHEWWKRVPKKRTTDFGLLAV